MSGTSPRLIFFHLAILIFPANWSEYNMSKWHYLILLPQQSGLIVCVLSVRNGTGKQSIQTVTNLSAYVLGLETNIVALVYHYNMHNTTVTQILLSYPRGTQKSISIHLSLYWDFFFKWMWIFSTNSLILLYWIVVDVTIFHSLSHCPCLHMSSRCHPS